MDQDSCESAFHESQPSQEKSSRRRRRRGRGGGRGGSRPELNQPQKSGRDESKEQTRQLSKQHAVGLLENREPPIACGGTFSAFDVQNSQPDKPLDPPGCEVSVSDKGRIRQRIWSTMEANDFVMNAPLKGRIPFFKGCNDACDKFLELEEFATASVIKVHPSLGATRLRELCVQHGKTLLTPPLPGQKHLYVAIDGVKDHKLTNIGRRENFLKHGRQIKSLKELPDRVDLVVVATVAVDPSTGRRLGKGKGYGEVEYGILREMNRVSDFTPVATICHDSQLVDLSGVAMDVHDLPVDIICTPTRCIRISQGKAKPQGIFWDMVSSAMMSEIGALQELKAIQA